MKAFVFPGQGAQFPGMGKDLFDSSELARQRFTEANQVLGFDIASIMFDGTDEELKQTAVTQPAIFLHSVILAECLGDAFQPDMVAGHSLGEFSALVAAGALSFTEGLTLVSARANAMQKACELQPSTMAAVLGLENDVVEKICENTPGVVVAANYNCPGQLVISGDVPAVEAACAALSEAGARRALMLPVGGAFHSPLMEPAREELAAAIDHADIQAPRCAIYQNVSAAPTTDPAIIREQLVAQLTAPVRWTQTMEAMIADGATEVTEVGPGKVLQGLFKKVDRAFPTVSAGLEPA
jgi:[acyl-carrier-protein] S-malonyltransferase